MKSTAKTMFLLTLLVAGFFGFWYLFMWNLFQGDYIDEMVGGQKEDECGSVYSQGYYYLDNEEPFPFHISKGLNFVKAGTFCGEELIEKQREQDIKDERSLQNALMKRIEKLELFKRWCLEKSPTDFESYSNCKQVDNIISKVKDIRQQVGEEL